MNLIEVKYNRRVKARIRSLTTPKSLEQVTKQNFRFNWQAELDKEIYSLLVPIESDTIGLMSLSDISNEYRIHINLIESSIPNVGKQKRFKNIPHCLLAFACKQAFALGYGGFVSLYPKTELIAYYKEEYGFEQYGRQLAIHGQSSYKLIEHYLNEK